MSKGKLEVRVIRARGLPLTSFGQEPSTSALFITETVGITCSNNVSDEHACCLLIPSYVNQSLYFKSMYGLTIDFLRAIGHFSSTSSFEVMVIVYVYVYNVCHLPPVYRSNLYVMIRQICMVGATWRLIESCARYYLSFKRNHMEL